MVHLRCEHRQLRLLLQGFGQKRGHFHGHQIGRRVHHAFRKLGLAAVGQGHQAGGAGFQPQQLLVAGLHVALVLQGTQGHQAVTGLHHLALLYQDLGHDAAFQILDHLQLG